MQKELRCMIYARRSSDRQNEESTAQQIAVCREFALKQGYVIVREFADEAISGKTDKRPEFQKLVRAVEAGKCDVVVAYKSNRISRNMLQALTYENRFEAAGVKLVYAKEEFGDNAAGRFALRTMMNLNQFYSENMSEDIKRSLYTYAQECKVLNGVLPYGLSKGADGRYAIDAETGPVVKEIFELYTSGVKSSRICDIINGKGYRTRPGNKFKISYIEKIIKNERYAGVYIYGDIRIEGGIPAIVDRETFEKAQKVLGEAHRAPAASWGQTDYLLTGKLFCGCCGSPMIGESGTSHSGKTYNYYVCSKKKKARSCDKKRVKKEYVEDLVIDFTAENALTEDVIEAVAEKAVELQANSKKFSALNQYRRRLNDVNCKIDNIVKAISDGAYSKALGAQLEELEKEQEELQAKIATTSYEEPVFSKSQFIAWMNTFKAADHESPEVRKQIIDIFINSVYLYDDKFTIAYNTGRCNDTLSFDSLQKIEAGEGSSLSTYGPPNSDNTNLFVLVDMFVMKKSLT